MTRPDADTWTHSAFYRFVPVADPAATARAVRQLALDCDVQGSIVLASEGISGAVAGHLGAVAQFEAALPFEVTALRGLSFKRSQGQTRPFARLKVTVKPEIVALGLPAVEAGGEALPAPEETDASHLSPTAWRALLQQGHAVVLDNRNHFEYRLGHFQGAVDPQVHNFRDFVAYVQANAPAWREAGRPVAMYCTGGVRCDKTAPWMRSLGLHVLQLAGGILNYCQQLPDADRDWQGECFVFDNRIALDATLREAPTAPEQVFDTGFSDEAWRLQRARRLDDSPE